MTRPLFKSSAAHVGALAFALCLVAPTAARAQSNDPHEAEVDRVSKENNLKRTMINIKPLQDVAQQGKGLYEQGKLSPHGTFDVTATAALKDDGSFDPVTLKIEGSASEEGLMLLASEFVKAVSESKMFSFLDGADEVRLALKLDQRALSFRAAAPVASERRASELAAGYGTLLHVARMKKAGTDEGEVWKSVQVSADGKQFVIAFEMPREAAAKLIADMLARKAAAGARQQQ